MPAELSYQAEVFGNRLKKRDKQLRRWASRRDVTCYRVYDRDIPDLPLVVDRYDSYLHINDYREPWDASPESLAAFKAMVVQTASGALSVPREKVFIKDRRRTSGNDQYQRLDAASVEDTVTEHGLQFIINMSDYVDTGLFLDHRPTRALVREWSAGASVLNLFSYTGSFTVAAAAGGARRTVSVDLSATYTAWCRRNLELNGLRAPHHELCTADVVQFLNEAPRRSADDRFNVIVLDPPTFSNSKKTPTVLDTQRDHARLINACLRLLTDDGVVLFSTNTRRFRLNDARIATDRIEEITDRTIDQDFLGKRPHRAWVIRPRSARGNSASSRPAAATHRSHRPSSSRSSAPHRRP